MAGTLPGEYARDFPKLLTSAYQLTSPEDTQYNCIAWAFGSSNKKWWPVRGPGVFWPNRHLGDSTIKGFQRAFRALGFEICHDEAFNPEVERLAFYAKAGHVQHAARQLAEGVWTSKLGKGPDISHDLRAVEGPLYGNFTFLMCRPAKKASN